MKKIKSTDQMPQIAIEKIPELQPYYDHVFPDDDEILPYAFFSTSLAMIIKKLYIKAYEEYDSKALHLLDRILDLVEELASNQNEECAAVIQLGLLHGFAYFGRYYDSVKRLLRPNTYDLLILEEDGEIPPADAGINERSYDYLDELIDVL